MARLLSIVAIASALCASAARAQSPVERGAYLVKAVAACGECHTNPAPGSPELAGGQRFVDIAYTAIAANLTPDPEFGMTQWTDAEFVVGIREGKRPKGSTIGPPMPFEIYRHMSDDDAQAIVAYLRSVPPVNNKVARSTYRTRLPDNYGPPLGVIATPPQNDRIKYGEYLVRGVARCMDCHSRPGEDKRADLANGLGAGGAYFKGAWGEALAPNITPSGIGHYSDAELVKIITTGVRPDGSKLAPVMPVSYYANMTAPDVAAVVAFLRTLPKK